MLKYWWLPLLTIFQTIDCVLALKAGIRQEANLLIVLVWLILGYKVVVVIKILTIPTCIAACKFFHHPKNPICWMQKVFHVEMAIIIGIGLAICIWNWLQLN